MPCQPGLLVARVVGDDLAAVGEQAQQRARRHAVAVDDTADDLAADLGRHLQEPHRAVGRRPVGGRAERPAIGLDVDRQRAGGREPPAQARECRRVLDEGEPGVGQRALRGIDRRGDPPRRGVLGQVGRHVDARPRELEVGHVREAVGRGLEEPGVGALGEVALEQRVLLLERERRDQRELCIAEHGEATAEPLRIRLRPQAQLRMDARGGTGDRTQRDRPERPPATARAALAQQRTTMRDRGQQRPRPRLDPDRRVAAWIERVVYVHEVHHRPAVGGHRAR